MCCTYREVDRRKIGAWYKANRIFIEVTQIPVGDLWTSPFILRFSQNGIGVQPEMTSIRFIEKKLDDLILRGGAAGLLVPV